MGTHSTTPTAGPGMASPLCLCTLKLSLSLLSPMPIAADLTPAVPVAAAAKGDAIAVDAAPVLLKNTTVEEEEEAGEKEGEPPPH